MNFQLSLSSTQIRFSLNRYLDPDPAAKIPPQRLVYYYCYSTIGFLSLVTNSGGLSGVLYWGELPPNALLEHTWLHYQWTHSCLWAQKNNSQENQIITFTKNKSSVWLKETSTKCSQTSWLKSGTQPFRFKIKSDRHMAWAWTKRPRAANTSNTRRWPFKSPEMGGEKKGSQPWDFICNIDVMSRSLVPRGSSNG